MTQKIRPPGVTDDGGPRKEIGGNHGVGGRELGFKEDLPDKVSAPDIGARTIPEGAINASGPDASSVAPGGPFAVWPGAPPGALDPEDAAEARASHGQQNRLGKPPRLSPAEKLLVEYQQALKAMKDEYHARALAGEPRGNSPAVEKRFLEAKQAMIDARLMTGDV